MSTGRNLQRCVLSAFLVGLLSALCLAQTAAETLDRAAQLFEDGQFEESRSLLMQIEPNQLTADQNRQRGELIEEVAVAINQSNKARRDLRDAESALEDGDRSRAAGLFRAVQNNTYATQDQKARARNGLATLSRQRELESQLAAPATRPAESNPPEAQEAPAQPEPVDRTFIRSPEAQPGTPVGDEAAPASDEELAAAAVRAGNEALGRGQLDLAERRFQEALRISPNLPDALSGLDLVRQYRRAEGQPGLLDEVQQRRRAVTQRTEVLFRQNEREIRQAIQDREFDVARERVELTRRLVESARRDFQPPERYSELMRQLDSLVRFIDSEERAYEQTVAAQQRRAARELEMQRRERDERERDERIGQLFERVQELRARREYERAADLLREILVIDPTYERARFLLDALEDAALIRKQRLDRQELFTNMVEALQEGESARNPNVTGANDKIVAYPSEEEWRIIAERDPFGAGATGEEEADRRTRERLRDTVPQINFPEGSSVEDVLEWIREQSGLSINVNWNALAILGIDRTSDTLGITLQNARYETIIRFLLDNIALPEVPLDYEVVDGIVRISTREDLDQNRITRVYDVSDLLIRIPSFRSEEDDMMGGGMMGGMGGGMMGGMMGGMGGGMMGGGMMGGYGGGGYGGGGGSYGSSDSEDEEDEETREEIIEEIEELIKNQIEPGTWVPEGTLGSLQVWNDRLIVTHTARAHQQLVDLLRQLREAKDLQVSVETKFIRLQSNFLEQIGVDLDIVLNQGNAGLDQAMVGGEGGLTPALDPLTGTRLLHPRQFTQLGFYPTAPGGYGVPFDQQALGQPYTNVAVVPPGQSRNWLSRHTTPVPIVNNTLALAAPRATNIPGSFAGETTTLPAFQIYGSFLDNLQVDFLLRASQLDARSSIVDAPRLVTFNNRGAYITVSTLAYYVALPGYLPAPGSGVGGQAAAGRDPTVSMIPIGRTLDVLPTVSADRRYVTLTVRPMVSNASFQVFQGATGPLQLPQQDYTTVRTSVNVPDRGWVLLGGLKQSGETAIEAGVPLISKIPILKRAYTNRSRVKDESVLFILLKPTIIVQGEQEEEAFGGVTVSGAGM